MTDYAILGDKVRFNNFTQNYIKEEPFEGAVVRSLVRDILSVPLLDIDIYCFTKSAEKRYHDFELNINYPGVDWAKSYHIPFYREEEMESFLKNILKMFRHLGVHANITENKGIRGFSSKVREEVLLISLQKTPRPMIIDLPEWSKPVPSNQTYRIYFLDGEKEKYYELDSNPIKQRGGALINAETRKQFKTRKENSLDLTEFSPQAVKNFIRFIQYGPKGFIAKYKSFEEVLSVDTVDLASYLNNEAFINTLLVIFQNILIKEYGYDPNTPDAMDYRRNLMRLNQYIPTKAILDNFKNQFKITLVDYIIDEYSKFLIREGEEDIAKYKRRNNEVFLSDVKFSPNKISLYGVDINLKQRMYEIYDNNYLLSASRYLIIDLEDNGFRIKSAKDIFEETFGHLLP